MTIKILAASMLVAVAVAGCGNTESKPESADVQSAAVPTYTQPLVVDSSISPGALPAGAVVVDSNTVVAPSASVAAPSIAPSTPTLSTTMPGMNPPHGQPGHDCAV